MSKKRKRSRVKRTAKNATVGTVSGAAVGYAVYADAAVGIVSGSLSFGIPIFVIAGACGLVGGLLVTALSDDKRR